MSTVAALHQEDMGDDKAATEMVEFVDGKNLEENDNVLDVAVEAKLTRKLDLYVMPILSLLYLLSFLDRANIGNANVASPSISTALGLTPKQFAASVSVVYATYIAFEPVWANLLKIVTPKILLVWGVITLGTAWARTYTHLVVIRLLLGIFEAGLFPCISIYVFMTYRREEIARRMSYIYAGAALSGACGGLIAYGLIHIETGNLVGWQYLYIVEGILSLAAGPLTYFWLPNRVDEAWFLNEEQKRQARTRTERNRIHYNPDEKFSWHQVKLGVLDWKTYSTGIVQFCAVSNLYGMSTFMPSIIKGLGYSNVNAQLLTVPVYFLAAAAFILLARVSDRIKMRSPIIALGFCFSIIGYAILAAVRTNGVRYFALYIVALGMYCSAGSNVSWLSGNVSAHYKRSTSFAIQQVQGNVSGITVGYIFLSTYAPYYHVSFLVMLGTSIAGLVMTGVTVFFLRMINKKRERLIAEGVLDQPELGDANPHFRYWL